VLEYGWAFFKVCVEELNKHELQQVKNAAMAHRVAQSKGFEDFMKLDDAPEPPQTDEDIEKLLNTPA